MNSLKTVLLCFCHKILRFFYVTGSARCSLALLISYKERVHSPKSQDTFLSGELERGVFLVVTILSCFTKA